jgi:uncharacterized RDD family membrane protein YckC
MTKVKNLRWLFVGLLAISTGAVWINPPTTLGVTVETSDGQYYFAGGTQPWALSLAALIILAYFVLMYAEPSPNRIPLKGLLRRFAAFWLDLFIAMMVVGPVAGILPALVEWRRSGVFEWSFERNTPMASDSFVAWAVFIAGILVLVFYFSWPVLRYRPSPGTCILGYQVIPEEGTSLSPGRAFLRPLLGFIAVCGAFAAFVGRKPMKGQFWLDKIFNTRAVRL